MPETESAKVVVVGAAGFVGGELLRLLSAHPNVAELRAMSTSHAGERWDAVHPCLAHVAPANFEHYDLRSAAEWGDVVFLALPHGRSQEVIEPLMTDSPCVVVDLAADFRVQDLGLYEQHYGKHQAPTWLDRFVYGLADVVPEHLHGVRCIAAPGCFATATLLGLFPLASHQLLDGPAFCVAYTGSSGSGAKAKPGTHHPFRAHNCFAYKLDGHRHEAEINEQLQRWLPNASCRLLPHSGPWVRGIHATLSARLSKPVNDLCGLLEASFAERPFIRVVDQPPRLTSVVGTNYAHIHGVTRNGGTEAVITVAIDNLVKGAAGQAIQGMNLARGWDACAGLTFSGLVPC